MTTQQIIDSFIAFNINAFNNIYYAFNSNICFILIAAAAVITAVLYAKEEVDSYVSEEQNVI